MNPQVALMILSLSCGDPALSFRDFYARYFHPGGTSSWAGFTGERTDTVMKRVADATGDYVEYRTARAETCGASK